MPSRWASRWSPDHAFEQLGEVDCRARYWLAARCGRGSARSWLCRFPFKGALEDGAQQDVIEVSETSRMEPSELRERAQREANELGPEPLDRRERVLWSEERRGCLILLDALADHDPALLRRAALAVAEDLSDPLARTLLLEAADAT
jgi:hypothetical protein